MVSICSGFYDKDLRHERFNEVTSLHIFGDIPNWCDKSWDFDYFWDIDE